MEKCGGGVILTSSSVVSICGQPSGFAYPSSKFAVNGMTLSLARELGPKGIRVNAVAPGVIDSPMNSAHLTPEEMSGLAEDTPLGRLGQAYEVAKAVRALAENRFITGQVLGVDGGFY